MFTLIGDLVAGVHRAFHIHWILSTAAIRSRAARATLAYSADLTVFIAAAFTLMGRLICTCTVAADTLFTIRIWTLRVIRTGTDSSDTGSAAQHLPARAFAATRYTTTLTAAAKIIIY